MKQVVRPWIEGHFDAATSTVSYIAMDPLTRECAIIDSVLDYDPKSGRTRTGSADTLVQRVRALGAQVRWLLETHVHADHLSAAAYLKTQLGGQTAIGEQITVVQNVFGALFNAGAEFRRDGSQFDRLLRDGECLAIGSLQLRAMHTPGHTPACMSYVIDQGEDSVAFVGDTLFMPDYGTARADFPGGDAATLYRSIRKILALPPQTRIFVGHDYLPAGRTDYRWETTVADQKAGNIHAHDGISEAEFVAMRTARDKTLEAPLLILPSLQVNIRAGAMPPASPGGHVYFKLPVNAI